MDQRLRLVADFQNNASSGVKKLAKDLGGVKPTTGMAAAQKWFSDFRGGAEKTVDAVKPVSGLLTGVGLGGLAASLSMGELVKQFRELADSTATMKELGRQSSMTTTEIARLQYAAGKLHVDPAAMSGAIGSWSSKMVEFRMHTSAFYRDLMRQNSDVAAKIESDSPVDGLRRALDFISRIKDPQIQKRWADDAGLGDLVPMLAKGPEGLADAYAEATREVKPLSKELEQQAEKLNESLNRLDTTWSNFKREFGPTVIGGISGAVDQLKSVLDQVDAAKQRYSGHPENVTKDATANENAIGSNFVKHWQEVIRGERPILPNPFDRRSWHFPDVKDGLFDYTKGGDGEAPSGLTLSKPGQTQVGEDGNALHRHDDDLSPLYRDGLRRLRSASEKWRAPDAYNREARARTGAHGAGDAVRRNDEMPAALTAQELFTKVREGSKEGIVAGLREMAQQQDLSGKGGVPSVGPGDGGGGRAGGGAGMPNMRYGRGAGGAYRHGPGAQGGDPGGAFNPQAPGTPGTYRQAYKLGAADLDDRVVNTIAGEAVTSNPESIDAVVNNMLNRVGSKGWGPSGNLLEVARAPGQYAGYKRPDAKTAERIRDRIRAIASGGVPDNTNGSNAYRAAWYHGPWYKQHAADGRVVGGNRFAYEPWTKNGPYAPFQRPTPGAGTPAPSAAAVTDAERFAAAQRILKGGRDPADRALIERYKAQQAKPEHRAAGGHIRGPGTGTSDSIPAWLSNGEFVVRAGAAGRFLPLLHAINDGRVPAFADGGPVGPKPLTIRKPWVPPVGFGVARRFYPTSSPGISDAEGRSNRLSWRDFFRRPTKEGGMGASWATTLGALAMMQGESGRGLNTKLYNYDVNGPSGGVDQLHDVTEGKYAGKLHRLSDAMTDAMRQHVDWKDRTFQQANFKKEATGSMWWAWRKMLAAKSAAGTLRAGVNDFENPANHELEFTRRLPNIARLAREAAADGAAGRREADPVQIDIHHHPHTGRPIVTARGGRGTKLGIRTAPTMRPT